MPHLSRKPLSKNLYEGITKELWWLLTNIKDEKEMNSFLEDLLTPTEKEMLSKRLAVACLILRGWDWTSICNLLHVSSSTVNKTKIWLSLSGSGFRSALKRLEKKEEWENFWQNIDSLLPKLPSSKADKVGWAKWRNGG